MKAHYPFFAKVVCKAISKHGFLFFEVYTGDTHNAYALVKWFLFLYNFIQQILNSGSAYVQILHAACQKFVLMKNFDNSPD